MKHFASLCLSILLTVPAFAQGNFALSLSRQLVEDMSQKTVSEFSAKYLVADVALRNQITNAFLYKAPSSPLQLPVTGLEGANRQIAEMSNTILRLALREKPVLPTAQGGYIPSFTKDSKTFIQQTGFQYSDMAVMLRHALGNPAERNFSGYFVKDFRELQKAALTPATGQTLDEALRTAYQQAAEKKQGILIITEERPEELQTFKGKRYRMAPAGLRDMYVMDWENGHWISYQQSVMDPVLKGGKKGVDTKGLLPLNGAVVIEREGGDLIVESGLFMKDSQYNLVYAIEHLLDVPQSSPWFEQLKYAKAKGYYILIKYLPEVEPGVRVDDLSKVTFYFARRRGEPLFDNVYELERPLMGLE